MFKNIGAHTLAIDDVKPSVVFEAYTHRRGVFGKEAKKDQFPDAFIFERVRSEGHAHDEMVIVSDDGDFAAAMKNAGTDEAGHAFQFEAGRVFRSEAGHPWRQSHGSI